MQTQAMLVVVGGPPAAGKSTLARWLARRLGWARLAKDDFKEPLFAAGLPTDRAASRRLSDAAWEALFAALEATLAAGGSALVEGNFRAAEHGPRLAALAARHGCRLAQVHCALPPAVRLARLRARTQHGRRHPGHRDDLLLAEAERGAPLPGEEPLPLDCPLLRHATGARRSAEITAARQALLAELQRLAGAG